MVKCIDDIVRKQAFVSLLGRTVVEQAFNPAYKGPRPFCEYLTRLSPCSDQSVDLVKRYEGVFDCICRVLREAPDDLSANVHAEWLTTCSHLKELHEKERSEIDAVSDVAGALEFWCTIGKRLGFEDNTSEVPQPPNKKVRCNWSHCPLSRSDSLLENSDQFQRCGGCKAVSDASSLLVFHRPKSNPQVQYCGRLCQKKYAR